jgi:hypothetical protein
MGIFEKFINMEIVVLFAEHWIVIGGLGRAVCYSPPEVD